MSISASFEKKWDAGKCQQVQAIPTNESKSENIIIADESVHRLTHPVCFSCGSYMLLLHDGKLCPACGRFAPASVGWMRDHPKYSGMGWSE